MPKKMAATIMTVLALVLCSCTGRGSTPPASSALSSTAGGGSTSLVSTAPATASGTPVAAQECSLPLTHATDTGFHVAVPSGWDLSSLNGQVVVARTSAQIEAVLAYPALLTNGLTAQHFFTTYLAKLQKDNAAAGLPVTIHQSTGSDGLPAINYTQTVNGTRLQGRAMVEVLPFAAPGASQEAVFVSYWAPASEFAGEASTLLRSIAACFGPEPASPFRIFQDQAFTYEMPSGWTVFDESSNGIDLHGPGASDVSYVLAGPVQTSKFDSTQTMIDWTLQGLGLTSVSSLSSVRSASHQAANGGTESDEYEQFTGRSGATAVRGLIFGYTVVGHGIASGFARLAVAPVSGWNALNGSMMQIAGSIQHKFTQDLQELQRVNHQWQNFSGQVANFDDTLNNHQLVNDPSTGINYEAPYSAWNANGPKGPGYYLANGDVLNAVSH